MMNLKSFFLCAMIILAYTTGNAQTAQVVRKVFTKIVTKIEQNPQAMRVIGRYGSKAAYKEYKKWEAEEKLKKQRIEQYQYPFSNRY